MKMELDYKKQFMTKNNLNTDPAICFFQCNPAVNPNGDCCASCFHVCPNNFCKTLVLGELPPRLELPPPPSPSPPSQQRRLSRPTVTHDRDGVNQKHLIITSITIVGCIIGAALLLGILWTILRAYYSRQRNSRRTRSAPIFFGTQDDFLDGAQGPEIDHHIWYINTVGLQQSVIEAIAVFQYKKGEGLIEGTECSVCLNEFQEDESLRLLPKCSHAFHIACIDTWLRSHKNCPLCRAPIVSDNFDAQFVLSVPTTSDSSSREESEMENSRNNIGLISNQVREDGTGDVRNVDDNNVCTLPIEDETSAGNSKLSLNHSILRNHSRVQSDLLDGRLAVVEIELQTMRRSVSLNASSASEIYNAVANAVPGKHQGNLDPQSAQLKYSKSKKVTKHGSSGNLSFHKLMKSSSIGLSLQKGPISMKRSFSSSRKSSSSRHSRSQDSILPL